ncbi:hypothetical protein GPECTOR_4g988 [Gonium pectorale]|uniref:phytol kinase n=1 Tax=Gonium pectorale TaxID=33097 RepID=A0A150GYC4_GONPE|nr:hypothetical protein GPECTOR_4g988 [Gonium pectorale]|eukprot:KXZ54916.1 hypothetical protein GPECTOR_4g988 [Gonium pectorale]
MQVHVYALGALLELGDDDRAEKCEQILGATFFLFIKASAFKSDTVTGGRLARALVRSGAFHLYARVITNWTDIPPQAMETKLRMLAQFSLVFSSCAQLTVGENLPNTEADPGGLSFYAEYLRALRSSGLLEHVSRMLLAVQASAHEAQARGALTAEQAHNVATGVVETCGCIVSALHGIAGKQGVLDGCWGAYSWKPHTPAEQAAYDVLPDARAVLSGPCLQFLLGRELVASRLRLRQGVGPRHGLPEAHIPELNPASPPISVSVAADRLLARLGAAALVWQMTVSGPRPTIVVSGVDSREPPARQVPYAAVNVFDLVAESVECVVAAAAAEHLPGGSQLTLVEPTLMLVRLMMELRAHHASARLPVLWRIISLLLSRPQVRLQYSRHRPLYMVSCLLQWDPADTPGGQRATAAAAGLARQQGQQAAAGAEEAAAPAEAAEAEGAGVPDAVAEPHISLRSALDAGLLAALELLLRRWASGNHLEAASCLVIVNTLLRSTGQWPAVLAHGSLLQVASLVATCRRLPESFSAMANDVASLDVGVSSAFQEAEVAVLSYQGALLEQVGAAMEPPGWRPPPGSPVAELLAAAVAATGTDLPLNGVISAQESAVLKRVHLLRVGGLPTRGSPAAEQQAALAVFNLAQWLPKALRMVTAVGAFYPANLSYVCWRWAFVLSLQYLAAQARLEDALAADGRATSAAGKADCGPGPSANVVLSSTAQAHSDAAKAWRELLAEKLNLPAWMAVMLGLLVTPPMQREGLAMDLPSILPLALDVLEALVVSLPLGVDVRVRWPSQVKASAGQGGVGGAAGAGGSRGTSAGSVGAGGAKGVKGPLLDIVVEEALLKALHMHNRNQLRVALENAADIAALEEAGMVKPSCGSAGAESGGGTASASGTAAGTGDTTQGSVATAVATITLGGAATAARDAEGEEARVNLERCHAARRALAKRLVASYGLYEVAPLPSPDKVTALLAEAGLVLCGNPSCVNLEGPSAAALSGRKKCARCRAVSYCSGACQLAHWQEGDHKKKCQGVPAEAAAGSRTG